MPFQFNISRLTLLALAFVCASFQPQLNDRAIAQQATEEMDPSELLEKREADTDTLQLAEKIIEIGLTDNRVEEHLDFLTNRIGPRLTGSEGLQHAGEWAVEQFKKMGLKNCRLEKWGEFPVGFERGPSFGRMLEPKTMTLNFGTNAWTAGTKGRSLGTVMIVPKTMEELEKIKDEVEGKFIFVERLSRRVRRRRSPDSESQKNDKQKSADADSSEQEKQPTAEEMRQRRDQMRKVLAALLELKPAGVIQNTRDDLILTGGNYRVDWDNLPTIPRISLQKKQFDEIKELVESGEEVKLIFDIRNHFRKGPIPLYNVIADIPGTEKPDEYVVVGGHLDSWDGATGATDNAAGCATTMEAARLLMAAGVKPKRTIRFMLWSGEEQGLLGSRAYVEQNPEEVQRISTVFVHDGGTNYVAGIRCTADMKEDFKQVFAPVMDMNENAPFEVGSVETMRPRGGSDHVPFIRAGVPGFFWMQSGRATYRTTHHTQFDTYESIVPEYQKHSSIVIAVGSLGVANLDHLISREGIQTGR